LERRVIILQVRPEVDQPVKSEYDTKAENAGAVLVLALHFLGIHRIFQKLHGMFISVPPLS